MNETSNDDNLCRTCLKYYDKAKDYATRINKTLKVSETPRCIDFVCPSGHSETIKLH